LHLALEFLSPLEAHPSLRAPSGGDERNRDCALARHARKDGAGFTAQKSAQFGAESLGLSLVMAFRVLAPRGIGARLQRLGICRSAR